MTSVTWMPSGTTGFSEDNGSWKIIDAAALSFLGAGNPDDTSPEWGQMLGKAQDLVDAFPHMAVYPALCIIAAALGFTLMGESLREALDPKSRR